MSFHVPETARDTTHPILGSTTAAGNNGAFVLESPEPGWRLALICSDCSAPETAGDPWEHVSVHAFRGERYSPRAIRTPTWREMAWVKDLCWDAEDVVMQLHPARSTYINRHEHVLHLWRPIGRAIPVPPQDYV